MRPDTSIRELLAVIRSLPPDPPQERPGKWYRTQHEHWIRWLSDYEGPGAYGRKTSSPADARSVYNRVVEPGMLLYLAVATGVDGELLAAHLPEPSRWWRLRTRSRV